ncbi:MAG: tRNA (guanosine(46)-N7)-methyltransferase TrmB [Myxococcota bacterium]
MSRALQYDIPGEDWRVELETLVKAGPRAVFGDDVPPDAPLVVEIGFGRGEFLMELAAASPDTAFLGIEYSFKRTLKLARRLAPTPLRNVRLVRATAEEVVRDALPDASVATFWVNFPDPWPKKRHARRRLFQQGFVARLAARLAPGGELNVATDDPAYALWIDDVLSKEPALDNAFAPDAYRTEVADRPATAYELKWRAEGRSFHFFRYTAPVH